MDNDSVPRYFIDRQTGKKMHPSVFGILADIPDCDSPWPEYERRQWLETLKSILDHVYREKE